MTIDKKKMSSLPPEERIRKLKELGDTRKKEINEIEGLIKESMHELQTNRLAEEIAPGQRPVDISALFESSETRDRRHDKKEGIEIEYKVFQQFYDDYHSLKKIMGYVSIGPLTEEQFRIVDRIGERIDNTKYEPAHAELANILDASRIALRKLRAYKG